MRIEHPAARQEYLCAVDYYAERSIELGQSLVDCFEEAVDDILDAPTMWPLVPDWNALPEIRSRKVHRFPFRVYYHQRGNEIVIIAYAHQSRRPGYWSDRLRNLG